MLPARGRVAQCRRKHCYSKPCFALALLVVPFDLSLGRDVLSRAIGAIANLGYASPWPRVTLLCHCFAIFAGYVLPSPCHAVCASPLQYWDNLGRAPPPPIIERLYRRCAMPLRSIVGACPEIHRRCFAYIAILCLATAVQIGALPRQRRTNEAALCQCNALIDHAIQCRCCVSLSLCRAAHTLQRRCHTALVSTMPTPPTFAPSAVRL